MVHGGGAARCVRRRAGAVPGPRTAADHAIAGTDSSFGNTFAFTVVTAATRTGDHTAAGPTASAAPEARGRRPAGAGTPGRITAAERA